MKRDLRLAIDSATDRLSVAAATGDAPPVELVVEGARQHASRLLPLVEQVVTAVGGSLDQLELVAVSDGPGSFTGLRVGIAAAKALVSVGTVPFWTAPSLLVRAAATARPGERVLALTSALRGEVYAGAWHFLPGGEIACLMPPRPVGAEALTGLPDVDRAVGDGPDAILTRLRQLARRLEVEPVLPSAATLIRLIGVNGGARLVESPATWEPSYGRPAEAQAKWEREHGRPLPDSPDFAS